MVLAFKHDQTLANGITNASLLSLGGTGHEIEFNDWEYIIYAIRFKFTIISLINRQGKWST